MKKILNLLAGVTLVASSAAPVVACGNKSNSDQDKVNSIVKDITNPTINNLAYGQGDYSFQNDQAMLKTALMKENKNLTTADEKYITVNPASGTKGSIPMEGTGTPASILVKVGNYSKTVAATYSVNNAWTKEASGIPAGAKFHVAPVKFGDTYYLGSAANGLWTKDSTQSKAQWTQVTGTAAAGSTSDFKKAIIDSAPVKWQTGGTVAEPIYTYFQATQNEGLWTSPDGVTWTQNADIPASANLPVAPFKIGNDFYLGTDGQGLWTSTNGTDWIKAASGIDYGIPTTAKLLSPVTRIQTGGTAAAPTYSYYQATDGNGLYKYTASAPFSASNALAANAWTEVAGFTPDGMVTAPVKIGNYLFQATTDGGLWRSKNNGTTWQQLPNIPATANLYAPPVNLGTTASPVLYQATVNNGLWRSTNKGDSWTPVKGIPQSHAANLVSAPKNLGTPTKPLYFQGSDGAGVWTSTDGINWTQNPTKGLKSANIESTPVKMDGVYVATSDSETTANSGLWKIKPPTS